MYQDSKEYIITFDAISGNIELTGDNGPIFGIEEWEDRITFHRVEIENYTKVDTNLSIAVMGLKM